MGKANLNDVLTLLRGWSDSEFAEAASGEFCEDIKTMIEGAISRALDPTTDASGLVEDIRSLLRLMEWAAGQGFCNIEGCADPDDMLLDLWDRYDPAKGQGDYSPDALASLMATTLTARVAEQDAEIARLRELVETASGALSSYACHAGAKAPCIRTPAQCSDNCGQIAGDALDHIEAALEAKP